MEHWVDIVVSRAIDIEIVFPVILLAIIIAGLVGPSVTNLILILAATRWVVFSRVARATTLSLRERDYVKSAQLLGVSPFVIIRRHILPDGFAQQHVVRGVLPGHGPLEIPAGLFVRVEDGHISRIDEYVDSAAIRPLREIGSRNRASRT